MTSPAIFETIKKTLSSHDVVLFMKGTAEFPACGFSNLVVQVLETLNVPFHDVNILEDQDLRQGIKDYTNWPTIPQLYIKGEFIGGADIVRELYQSGEFEDLLKSKNITHTPEAA
ncbi:MAG: Grx4 family monothiol glutaredoxin [Alphaproteobacteria bacterium]|jgi:monothiol glutaredoxin|nr:Grx4 family monothiol glutaredoxin [Alphaproteobacteria bacterium]